MLLKPPAGCAAVSAGGHQLALDADGNVHVDDWPTAKNLMDAFGFTAVLAAPAESAPMPTLSESVLRAAAIQSLALLGIEAPADADDALIAHALVDAVRDRVRPTT